MIDGWPQVLSAPGRYIDYPCKSRNCARLLCFADSARPFNMMGWELGHMMDALYPKKEQRISVDIDGRVHDGISILQSSSRRAPGQASPGNRLLTAITSRGQHVLALVKTIRDTADRMPTESPVYGVVKCPFRVEKSLVNAMYGLAGLSSGVIRWTRMNATMRSGQGWLMVAHSRHLCHVAIYPASPTLPCSLTSDSTPRTPPVPPPPLRLSQA